MKEYVFYADDSTRFSSVVERNHYNELLKKKKENREASIILASRSVHH